MVPPVFWIVTATILGAIFGSYINMAAYRLPRGISTWRRARSFCPKCNHELAWYDNIPIFSYMSLQGKCRYCSVRIPPRYLVTELIVAAFFTLAAYQFFQLNGGPGGTMPTARFVALLFLIVDFVLLSVVDWESYLIPIETTLYWIVPALIVTPFFPEIHSGMTIWTRYSYVNGLIDAFTGMVVGGAMLWVIGVLVTAMIFVRNTIRGIHEPPPEAMGIGDVHMMMLFGAIFGWKAALLAILCGVVIGAMAMFKLIYNKIQRWRLGDKWKPKPPTFELPEDGEPYEMQIWMPPVFGAIVLIVATVLEDQRRMIRFGGSFDYLVPVSLLFFLGAGMVLAFFFFLYLKSKKMLPGGQIVENSAGVKEEVYHGNYIPFGPSLALGSIFVAFCDPMLRAYAFKFFVQPGSTPSWSYRIAGEAWIAAVLDFVLNVFMAMGNWLKSVLGL